MRNFHHFLPLAAFCIYFLKVAILPSSYPEALILLILGAVAGYFEFKHQDGEIKNIMERLNKMDDDVQNKLKDMEALKSSMAGLKLQNGMRQVGTR